jgi:hypothetical protein
MDNMDMAKLMNMLSKMDKKELEQGLYKAAQILNSPDKDKIINEISKNQNNG